MYYKTILTLAFGLFLFSCENQSAKGKIELDNGVRWQVNAEMMPPIKSSEKLISEFSTTDKKEYKALAEKLNENIKMLISTCTMKGKSHDELHKWLHPYMTMVDKLTNAENESEENQLFLEIEHFFESFNQYFQ